MTRFAAIGLSILFCAAAANPAEPPKTGKFRGDLTDPASGEVLMKVALQAPEKLPEKKHLGLLFLCHGFQGNEGNYIGLTVEALKRLQLLDQYVVISGKSKGPGWTTEDDARVLRVIQWAKETYPIDSRRVFIFGSSNGAAFIGRFASAHPEVFAGAIGYCGSYKFSPELKADKAAETRTEWYFVHGSKDNPQNSRRACATLKENGYRYIFRQMDGYGHTDIWDSRGHPDSSQADAVRDDWLLWLHALRHKTLPLPAEDEKTLAALPEKLKNANREELTSLLNEVARIGGAQAGRVIAEAMISPDPAVRLAATRTTERTLYGTQVIEPFIRLLDDDEERQVAALRGLARAANWRQDKAQSILAGLSSRKKLPTADRVHIIDLLGQASRLNFLGNFEDGRLIWALVLLLDDEQEPVRQAAFAVLQKNAPDTFGYKPDQPAADRRAALEKWLAWCKEKCGPMPE